MTTIEWNTVTQIYNRLYTSVTYSKKDNNFYSLGRNTDKTELYIAKSSNGINWTDVYSKTYTTPLSSAGIIGQIFYIEERDIYIAFIPNTAQPYNNTDCITSNDGITWMYQSTINNYSSMLIDSQPFAYNKNMVYDTQHGVFLFTLTQANLDPNRLFRSTDGKNWTLLNLGSLLNGTKIVYSMTYTGGTILAITVDSINTESSIIISQNGGNTWSVSFTPTQGLTQITSSDNIITAFSFNQIGDISIFTSKPNEISWKETTIPNTVNLNVYQNLYINGLFTVFCVINGTKNFKYGTSFDGINWIFNTITSSDILGLSYSTYLNKYITFKLLNNNNSVQVLLGLPNIEPICLPSGSPVVTDQGLVDIEKLDIAFHTISGKRIVAVTQTITPEKSLVCFEKNSLGINCPNKRTIMTQGHEVLYKGKLVQAKHFVGRLDGVHTVSYDGKVLYNVLHKIHGLMNVNNMTLETLNPTNRIAKSILQNIN
jgi:hypothetical protein